MSKEKKGIILLSSLVLLLLVFIYILVNRRENNTFYVRVKESFGEFSLVEVLDSKKSKYDYLEINVGSLNAGDILIVNAKEIDKKNYPVRVVVSDYTYVTSREVTTTVKEYDLVREDKMIYTKTTTTTSTSINSDEVVLTFLTNASNEDSKSFKEKCRDNLVKGIDFIFYGKDIKGVYFKDLTNGAKLKAIALLLELDSLIDSKYPKYKDNLDSKYTNIKDKLISYYLDKSSEYCANNEDVCDEAKANFSEFKDAYGITWEFIKNLGESGINKLKEWYEVYRSK